MDSYLAHIESNDSYNKIKSYAGKYLSSAMAGYENEKKSKAWRKINEIINAGDMFVLIKEELHAMEIYLEAGKRCIEQEKDAEDSRIKGKITDLLIMIKNKMTEQKGIWENFAETKKEEKNKSEYKQKENLKRECDAFIREVSKEYEYKKIEFKNKKWRVLEVRKVDNLKSQKPGKVPLKSLLQSRKANLLAYDHQVIQGDFFMRYSKSYRVLRLYTWLEQRKTISLSGTAADFGIDERTVQRDIADIRAFLADFNTETGKRRIISYNRGKDSYVMKIDGM